MWDIVLRDFQSYFLYINRQKTRKSVKLRGEFVKSSSRLTNEIVPFNQNRDKRGLELQISGLIQKEYDDEDLLSRCLKTTQNQ